MAEPGEKATFTPAGPGPADDEDERIPFMQRLLDNHFLLLFLGLIIPTVFYIIWGVIEVITIPLAQ